MDEKPPEDASGGFCHIKFNVIYHKAVPVSLDEKRKGVYALGIVEVCDYG